MHEPELYDPGTRTWRTLAPSSRDRVYHNSAVLLPDGRVLVVGHAPHSAHYLRYGNEATRSNNFRDATFEIYEPPYLFRGKRPRIRRVTPVRRGSALRLDMGSPRQARRIADVTLVRMGANTHAMDADQRALKLSFSASGGRLLATLPHGGDGRVLPPGPYYVFASRDTAAGPVPSVARVVLMEPAGGGRVTAHRALRLTGGRPQRMGG